MKIMTAAIALLTLAVQGCQSRQPPREEYKPRRNFLSGGDAIAGRKVFYELKCNTCHAVAGERIDVGVTVMAGPSLGSAHAAQSASEIAASIAAPSHGMSQIEGPRQKPGGPAMGDYSRVLTVRQLVDLVAYIRSLPDGE
jgi:mono/diheme cytochrome c family protein